MSAVPVSLGYLYEGMAECDGLLRIEEADLVLEYQSKDALVGIVKSDVHETRIPRELLASVRIEKGVFGFGTKVVIQTARMQAVADVPGMTKGRLVLGVARKDVPAAKKLVADLGLLDPTSVKPARIDTGLD